MIRLDRHSAAVAAALLAVTALSGCDYFGKDRAGVQTGYRGTAMEQVYNEPAVNAEFAKVVIPEALPPVSPSTDSGPLPWQNVQVLNDISVAEFNRTMVAMSTWVAGTGNCGYCHNLGNLAADTTAKGEPLYTKIVARRMIQMTRHINSQYPQHVANTGVTCYTCHMGKPLPNGLWFYASQNDHLRHYLDRDGARVISHDMAPSDKNRSSVKQTEWTYKLMISQSNSLGVNCTYCHNSRLFSSWEEAPPQRVTAYHGILMLRDVNTNFLAPLQPVYPEVRLGKAMGDAPKAQCLTCHNGAYKPLYGAQMVKDYPAFWGRPDWNGVPFPGRYMQAAAAEPAAEMMDSTATPTVEVAPVPAGTPATTPSTPSVSSRNSTPRTTTGTQR
jgi:photosynthetic reaction center cytochrome c subunit